MTTTAVLVTFFWMIAAGLVLAVHAAIEPLSSKAGAAAEIAALILTAYAYSRCAAREAGITHALGVGIAWLVLSIATEIVLATHVGHGWFTLLGSPDRPLLRSVLLFVWIFAPALFARPAVDGAP
jgi:hypothetical protein